MGIGRQQFQAALASFKTSRTGPGRRAAVRDDVREMVAAAQLWLQRQDEQLEQARVGFAADRPGQFNTYVESLPEVPAPADE